MATEMAKPPPQPVTQTPTQAQAQVQAQAQAQPPSSNPPSARTRPEGVRYRASKACRRCNEKRVNRRVVEFQKVGWGGLSRDFHQTIVHVYHDELLEGAPEQIVAAVRSVLRA